MHINAYIWNLGTSLVAQLVKNLPSMWETWVQSLGWEDLLEKETATHSSTIAGKSHGRRSLVGYSPWGREESDTTEQLHFLSLSCEVENVFQSNVRFKNFKFRSKFFIFKLQDCCFYVQDIFLTG